MNFESELVRIYGAARRRITDLILSAETDRFDSKAAFRIQEKMKSVISRLNKDSVSWATRATAAAYRESAAKTRVSLDILGKTKNNTFKPAERPEDVLARSVAGYLLRANASMKKTVDRFIEVSMVAANVLKYASVQEFSEEEFAGAHEAFNRMAVEAVAENKSRGWLYQRIREHLRSMVIDGDLVEINGRFYNANKYAKMVARTTMRDSATKATVELCRIFDNDLVEFSYHKTSCDLCKPYEGNVYSLSGKTAGFPILPERPPIHPNCKHSLLPTSEEALEARGVKPAIPPQPVTIPPDPTKGLNFLSIKDAEKWALDNIASYVDLSKVSKDVANLIVKNLAILKDRIKLQGIMPLYDFRRKVTKIKLSGRTIFAVIRTWTGDVYFVYSPPRSANIKLLDQMIKNLKDSKLLQKLDYDGFLIHETGHIINFAVDTKGAQNLYLKYTDSFASAAERALFEHRMADVTGSYMFSNVGEFYGELYRLYKINSLPPELSFAADHFKSIGW